MCIYVCVCVHSQDVLWWTLSRVEPWLLGPFNFLRRRALNECMKHIHYEVTHTHTYTHTHTHIHTYTREIAVLRPS